MKPNRSRLLIKIGDLFELIAAMLACGGVYYLVGLGWTLLAAAAFLIVGAEFVYDQSVLKVSLPRRRRPIAALRACLQRSRSRRRLARSSRARMARR